MSHDIVIVEAENLLMFYQRGLRDGTLFGQSDVERLVNMLETVLDKHAELAVAFEPKDFDEEDIFLDPDFDDDSEFEYDGEPDETFD